MKKFTLWLLFAFVALVANAETASVYLKGEVYGWKDNNGVKLEYNSTEAAYVYTETNTANLASDFKIWIFFFYYFFCCL